jgi:hypothetical protein
MEGKKLLPDLIKEEILIQVTNLPIKGRHYAHRGIR